MISAVHPDGAREHIGQAPRSGQDQSVTGLILTCLK
jgi:hypothetical protein